MAVERLAVAPAIYRLSWWLIFIVHLLNGALVFVIGSIYLFFSRSKAYGNVSLLQIPQSTLQLSGWSHLVLACVHAYGLFGLVHRSVRAGRLTLRQAHNAVRNRKVQPIVEATVQLYAWWDPRSWQATTRRKYSRLFGVDGTFGFYGVYFYQWFIVREALEVGLQTYQANQISRSVSRRSINALAAATVMVNCISTPVVFYVFRKRDSVGRLVNLLVDTVLDFTSSTVLPLAVVYPYIAAYDTSAGILPLQLTLDDAWFVGAVEVIRQSAVTSLVDYSASLMPHASVISCLNIAKSVIHRDHKPDRRISMRLVNLSAPSQTITRAVPVSTRPRVSIHAILSFACAGFVLVTHVLSQHHKYQSAENQDCRLPMKPWFASQIACAVVHINCYRDETVGQSDEIRARLVPFDRSMVTIIITHCPALEIPPVLQEFRELTNFAVHNVTLTTWSTEAAFTGSTNPRLTTIDLIAIRVIGPLDDICDKNVPKSLSFFTLAKSNLTALPDDLGALWKRLNLQVFNAQFTELRRLPLTFGQLSIRRVRLISNALETVDELGSGSNPHQLTALHLSGNPLQRLPASIGDISQLTELLVEDTNATVLPHEILAWVQKTKPTKVSFNGSPLCKSPPRPSNELAQVCSTRFENAKGTLSWDIIASQRPLEPRS